MASTEITKIEYSAESQSSCHNVLVFAVFVLAFVLAFVVMMNREIRSVMITDVALCAVLLIVTDCCKTIDV